MNTEQSAEKVSRFDWVGYQRLWKLLKPYGKRYFGSFVSLVILNIIQFFVAIVNVAATAAMIDALLGNKWVSDVDSLEQIKLEDVSLNNIGGMLFQTLGLDQIDNTFKLIVIIGSVALGVVVVRSILNYMTNVLAAFTSQRTAHSMQVGLFEHYMRFSIGFFTKNRMGWLISRMEADTGATAGGFQSLINSFVVCPLLIVFYMVITAKASWMLLVSIILAGFAHHILSMLLSKPMQLAMHRNLNVSATYRAMITEVFTAIRVVKSFAAERSEVKRIEQGLRDMRHNAVLRTALQQAQIQGRGIINFTVKFIIILFAAYELTQGTIKIESCILFLFISDQMVKPITQISEAFLTMKNMVAASERVDMFFTSVPDIVDGKREAKKFEQSIELKQASFTYEAAPVPAVFDINLTLKKGEVMALVGPSGAGKSTLADLFLRFYDPQDGEVLIDGVPVREYRQESYRKLFGIVSQESLLFNASIRENIGYGLKGADQEEVERAARIANAHQFITDMPEGYDTIVGDRGVRLSGGQRQRIAIARAMCGHPEIIVLDEATSALDSESEKEVQDAINEVTQNTTALIIAHRLSTVMKAHQIVVMEQGKVLDIGRHEELLNRCALYTNLCRLQFGGQRSGDEEGLLV